MKKIILLAFLLPLFAKAQNFHFSGRFGLSNYMGDLKEKSLSLKKSKFLGSLGVRYDVTERLVLRSYLTLTSLQADDKDGSLSKQTRNLNFKSKIFDWEGGVQYNILDPNVSWWIPYVYAGIGAFHFKPYTNDAAGDKVFLKPLSTEGQGFRSGTKNYGLTQFSIPFGIGVDRSINEDIRVGLEMGYRKTFTDYIDDVSTTYVDQAALQNARGSKAVELAYRYDEISGASYPAQGTLRGNADNKDAYFYIALTVTVRHFFDSYKKTSGIPGGRKEKRAGCPAARNR
jgi:Domain of unknown function (DUF6089)